MYPKSKKIIIFIISAILILGIVAFFDKVLVVGSIFLIFLCLIVLYILRKFKIGGKLLVWLFLIVILMHFGTVLFVHYAHFQPFSGGVGDYLKYQPQAVEIARRVHQWNFSLENVDVSGGPTSETIYLYHTIAIGYVYALTLPEMLIGQIFNAWVVALSIIFIYLIVRKIGGSKKWAFLIGLIVSVYPSYLFYGSLLLKDCFVILFSLISLLFLLRLIESFTWKKFALFYLFLGLLTNSRFYISYAIIFTFIFCWFILSKVNLRKRVFNGVVAIVLFGFLFQVFAGHGYYSINLFKHFLKPETITFYREVAFIPPSLLESSFEPSSESSPEPSSESSLGPSLEPLPSGNDSTIVIKTEFDKPLKSVLNYLKSCIYSLLGPLPWHMKYARQLFALVETIPWYILLFFIVKGAIVSVKRNRIAIPLIVFSLGVFGMTALYFTNFGQVMRIRMPAFISLLCLIPVGFIGSQEKTRSLDKRIKVCQVTNIASSIKFIILSQIKLLQKEGYEVSSVCSPGKLVNDIEKRNIKVKTIKFKRKLFSPISDLISLVRLFFYFKKEKFDIVHTHTPKAGFIGQIAAKMAGVPIIIHTNHGFYFQKKDPWLKRNLFILVEKTAAMCSDLILSVNKEDIETAVGEKICSLEKIKYLGGWVNLEKFNPHRFSEKFIIKEKKQFGINPDSKIIGIVARMVKEKGYLDLFKAFKNILDKFPNTVLLVVGPEEPEKKDGIDSSIFKKYRIEKNAIFLGARADIDEIFPLIDIFVLPSYREGMGLSILEASAMEKPVVATDVRGCREAVDDGKTGILVPARNPEKLTEALIYFLENSEKGKEMGKKGRIKVVNEFDEKLIFEMMIKEYQRLIKEKLR